MQDESTVTMLRFLALDRDEQRSQLRESRQASQANRTNGLSIWIDILSAIGEADDIVLEADVAPLASASEARQLMREWKCFAEYFRRFLLNVATYTPDEPDEETGVYKLDYKYGHALLRRLSRMVLDACGLSRALTDVALEEMLTCVFQRRAGRPQVTTALTIDEPGS
jgi:hypothetical protein